MRVRLPESYKTYFVIPTFPVILTTLRKLPRRLLTVDEYKTD
jgi:hypothetical protein